MDDVLGVCGDQHVEDRFAITSTRPGGRSSRCQRCSMVRLEQLHPR
jgi:hypothetical protein